MREKSYEQQSRKLRGLKVYRDTDFVSIFLVLLADSE